ncbi:hypothetical protein PTSG_11330 [Salpingoeca rosetta]|uniref:RXYLT1 C-terminal domain-containing protein n=1 Tax=Salpingoeca rosetta (strain ATCC 50818 / BSB-021) TaxID=946362 RepID=F2UT34_SALR5|nr:uncharacterized protein PTSG_11330 [Salpingoeca rosetta]EGD81293.1 hypothetical protein PTSG_11330 [Salpingoeca rosetta]|eukprot:XP_004987689.1 hypothetical protein PTSG_11330 [Salpingoeca rosetta]
MVPNGGDGGRTLFVSLIAFVVLAAPGLYILVAPSEADTAVYSAHTQRLEVHGGELPQLQVQPAASSKRQRTQQQSMQQQTTQEQQQTKAPASTANAEQGLVPQTASPKNDGEHTPTTAAVEATRPAPPGKLRVRTENGPYDIREAVRVCHAKGHARPPSPASSSSSSSSSSNYVYLGCLVFTEEALDKAATLPVADSWDACASACTSRHLPLFMLFAEKQQQHLPGELGKRRCACFSEQLPTPARACTAAQATVASTSAPPAAWGSKCDTAPCLSTTTEHHLYHIGQYPSRHMGSQEGAATPDEREHVDVHLFVHDRLSSLWHTCRLAHYSTRYNYRVYDQRFQHAEGGMVDHVLHAMAGPKLIVLNACCSKPELLLNWPDDAVLVIAADESARWGFSHPNGHVWWGPHGKNGPLATDASGNMVLPPKVTPLFKQYYSAKHVDVYGDDVHFLPLGSRYEFQDPPANLVPSTRRRYVYSFMGATTNPMRKQLVEVMQADTLIPKEKAFLHLIRKWATDPNDPSTGYLNSTQYAQIMSNSVFTMCPKGNSIEQFRIYEAIEVGSIPVICMEGKYARERLPPEMFESPILLVDDWSEAPQAMMEVYSDPAALLARQMALAAWYDAYMRARIHDIEAVLQRKSSSPSPGT